MIMDHKLCPDSGSEVGHSRVEANQKDGNLVR